MVGSCSVNVVPDARGFTEKLRAQMGDLPAVAVNVDADTAAVDAQLVELTRDRTAKIRAEVEAAAAAKAQLDETAAERKVRLQAEADVTRAEQQLGKVTKARAVQIRAEADTAAAEEKLVRTAQQRTARIEADVAGTAAADAKLDAVAHERRAKIVADVDKATLDKAGGQLGTLVTTAAGLGPALIPVAAVAAAGIGGIGVAAVAAGAGLGVLLLATHGIGAAVTAQTAATKAAATDAVTQTQKRIADQSALKAATDGLAGAEAAEANGAISAAEAVATARRGAVDAAIQAAQSVAAALSTERSAENTLASAQRSEQQAQVALTQARKDAQRQLEDLAQQAADGAISQRGATLSLQEAQQSLNNTLADPLATTLQRERAQLNYDQAKQQLVDIQTANQRTAQDKADADKKGVDGAKGVVTAQDQMIGSVQAVGAAQSALATAQAGYTDAQRRGAESVTAAEQGVSDALRAQSEQARTSAAAVVTASAAVAAAQRQSATDASTATAAQLALAQALAALSPAGRVFAEFVTSTLKPAFKDLTDAAQTALMPGLTAGFQAAMGAMEPLRDAVSKVGKAMGDLFASAGRALASPFWQTFIRFVGENAGPVLKILGETIGNLARGFASLLMAFKPVAMQLGLGFQDLTAKFAAWAAKLATSKGFQNFVDYVKTNGPKVADTLKAIFEAIGHVIASLAPMGGPALGLIKTFAGAIAGLSPDKVRLLAGAIVAVKLASMVSPASLGILVVIAALKVLPTPVVWALAAAVGALVLAFKGVQLAMKFDAMYVAIEKLAVKWGLVTASAGSAAAAEGAATAAGSGAAIEGAAGKTGLLSKAWGLIKIAVLAVAGAVSLTVGLIIGVIIAWGVVIYEIISRWDEVKSAFQDDIWGPISRGFQTASRNVKQWMKDLANGVIWAINEIIGAWDHLHFTIPPVNWGPVHLPGLNVGLMTIPKIPTLAEGGIVSSPTMLLAGEAGPEAIVPLPQAGLANALGRGAAPSFGQQAPEIRVFIGDTELRGLVRTEVVHHDAGQARQLAYGRTG